MFYIRIAAPTDLPRLVEIYNQAIASQSATADTIPFSVEARRGWFTAHVPDAYPIYVCVDENHRVIGYICLSPYRNRPALARTAEVSYYLDYSRHGQGVGSALLRYALEDAGRIGKKVYLAILPEGNTGSIRLLEKRKHYVWYFRNCYQ